MISGTRVYIMLSYDYKGKVEGMCGNFNHKSDDDFVDKGAGFVANTAREWGNHWAIGVCADADVDDDYDPCKVNKERLPWASQMCGIISEGAQFEECRKVVPNWEDYVGECMFDSCGCDKGGDCECMCTSLANFAAACAAKGKPVSWRSQSLCRK